MSVLRILLAPALFLLTIAGALAPAPAAAQFFLQNPVMATGPVRGDEPDMVIVLPNATTAEMRAGMAWSLRAALNVAALQCSFEPTLLTVPNYNAVLTDHQAELKASFDTLTKYFLRTAANKKAGQAALDRFGTKIYSSFSTVAAQYIFCQTAASIGYEAITAKRGEFASVAVNNLRALRSSLVPRGEQRFAGRVSIQIDVPMPNFNPACWRRDRYDAQRCPLIYTG